MTKLNVQSRVMRAIAYLTKKRGQIPDQLVLNDAHFEEMRRSQGRGGIPGDFWTRKVFAPRGFVNIVPMWEGYPEEPEY